MILDSSAIVAILTGEAAAPTLARATAREGGAVGTPTLVETAMVLAGKAGVSTRVLLTGFLQEFRIETLPFEEHHWPVALEAFTRFGKGRHAAGLNLGDCFTYATARVAGEPLLCLGDDFAQTDLEVVAL